MADDVASVGLLLKQGILAVPGTGFGRGGFPSLSARSQTCQLWRRQPFSPDCAPLYLTP